jgi:hypothetical protein
VTDQEKLRILLTHWIEHNREHSEEFGRWIGRAGAASAEIEAAVDHMTKAGADLEKALEKLGGPAEHSH